MTSLATGLACIEEPVTGGALEHVVQREGSAAVALVFCYERSSAPKMLHMAATASDLVIYKRTRERETGPGPLACPIHESRTCDRAGSRLALSSS